MSNPLVNAKLFVARIVAHERMILVQGVRAALRLHFRVSGSSDNRCEAFAWRHDLGATREVLAIFFLLAVIEVSTLVYLTYPLFPPLAIFLAVALAYTAIWTIGDVEAARRSRIELLASEIRVEYGVAKKIAVPIHSIKAVTPWRVVVDAHSVVQAHSPMVEPNVLIYLQLPVLVEGRFGRTDSAIVVAIKVQDAVSFRNQIQDAIQRHGNSHPNGE